ncbi:hypothetical protein [Leptospira jelokensis]|uniref:Uncharacterized protein n=1 Tax=Leptospira jelokensis TaxID=2484931 RepID=A0A4Z0ZY08_9LEPT|nr:hypothetical protein [Leptospira jelokensis]TGL58628.1 hypothetical protein EHQ62_17185 [Leptospira jelokensis]
MEVHRIKLELLSREGNSTETILERIEKEVEVTEPQFLTKLLEAIGEENVPVTHVFEIIPELETKYILMECKYVSDDFSLGIKKGQLAPISCKFTETEAPKLIEGGFLLWFGEIDYLEVLSSNAQKVKVEIYVG